ncbi:MAG: N-methyl-L-tryptophan oxidase [Betaproteobacteria bacterium]
MFDVIVVGVGGMGSASLYHLARRGLKVLGIERFGIPHDRGSSHGVNRIIRLAYLEHPSYVPLLRRAYELWRDLERDAGEPLLFITGSLDIGAPGSQTFDGSQLSCRLHDLEHEILAAADLRRRFPGYAIPDGLQAVYQPDGGFVLAERSVERHVEGAVARGAAVRTGEQVLDLDLTGDPVTVRTDRGVYHAPRVVVTAGPWAGALVPSVAALARPERQVLMWTAILQPERFTPAAFPVFNLEAPEGRFYGFPEFGVPGFKIGKYHHRLEAADPDRVERGVDSRDEEVLRDALGRYFPAANGRRLSATTCLFTNSPDEHFILDLLSGDPRVTVAAGFSGHGFKFCSVIGEIVADLATRGRTTHDISLFRLSRYFPGKITGSASSVV